MPAAKEDNLEVSKEIRPGGIILAHLLEAGRCRAQGRKESMIMLTEIRRQLQRLGFSHWSVAQASNGCVTLSAGPIQATCAFGNLLEALQQLPDGLGAMIEFQGQRPTDVLWEAVLATATTR